MLPAFEQLRKINIGGGFKSPFSDATRKLLSYDEDELVRGSFARAGNRYRRAVAYDLIMALTPEQVETLVIEAMAYYTPDDDASLAILREIAILRPEFLIPFYATFVDQCISDNDGLIYHGADGVISERLLAMVR